MLALIDPSIPDGALVSAGGRTLMFLLVFSIAWPARQLRHWPVPVACLLVISSNIALVTGNLTTAGLLAVPFAGLVCWLMIDRLKTDPRSLNARLASQEADWSRERHDLKERLAICRGQLKRAEERLAQGD